MTKGRKTLHPRPHAMIYSIVVDDDENYFNITMPSQICPDAVIGDLLSLQGDLMENVTLARIHDTIRSLSPTEQKSYMSTILQMLYSRNMSAMCQQVITEASYGTVRRTTHRTCGYWSLFLTGAALEIGVAYGGYVLSGYGGVEVHFPNGTKGAFAAGAAVLRTGVGVLWTKWPTDGHFKSMDAIVASAFVAAVKAFAAAMKRAVTVICTAPLWKRFRSFIRVVNVIGRRSLAI